MVLIVVVVVVFIGVAVAALTVIDVVVFIVVVLATLLPSPLRLLWRQVHQGPCGPRHGSLNPDHSQPPLHLPPPV